MPGFSVFLQHSHVAKGTEFQDTFPSFKISYGLAYFVLALCFPKRDNKFKWYREKDFKMYGFIFLWMERSANIVKHVIVKITLLQSRHKSSKIFWFDQQWTCLMELAYGTKWEDNICMNDGASAHAFQKHRMVSRLNQRQTGFVFSVLNIWNTKALLLDTPGTPVEVRDWHGSERKIRREIQDVSGEVNRYPAILQALIHSLLQRASLICWVNRNSILARIN